MLKSLFALAARGLPIAQLPQMRGRRPAPDLATQEPEGYTGTYGSSRV
jgi:hypothetical protein